MGSPAEREQLNSLGIGAELVRQETRRAFTACVDRGSLLVSRPLQAHPPFLDNSHINGPQFAEARDDSPWRHENAIDETAGWICDVINRSTADDLGSPNPNSPFTVSAHTFWRKGWHIVGE